MGDSGKINLEMSEAKSWSDHSQDILGLFLEKLHLADQIRFRAVCKSWHVPEDRFKYCNALPWAVNLANYPSSWEFFDPHSRKSYQFTNSTEKLRDEHTTVYASKHGWLLLVHKHSTIFLHNPFTNETIFLPDLPFNILQATFTANPKSLDCEVLVMSGPTIVDRFYTYDLSINRYALSGDTQWSTELCRQIPQNQLDCEDIMPYLRTGIEVPRKFSTSGSNIVDSIHYMDGKLYCLVMAKSLMCYDLADRSWRALLAELPQHLMGRWGECEYRLTQNGENLILICSSYLDLEISAYDRSNMCWAGATNLNDTWFFISGRVILSAPLDENWNESEDGIKALKLHSECSSSSMEQEKSIHHYGWIEDERIRLKSGKNTPVKDWWHKMCFIEPPHTQ